MENLKLYRREEDLLSHKEKQGIAELLEEAFSSTFDGRIYCKQLPSFRFVATRSTRVVGQVGVCHRVVRLGNDNVCRIYGIIDLAVATTERGNGLGTRLLGTVGLRVQSP